MAYDKSVFILGAGASVPAGAPVLNDFLKKARELLDNPNSLLDSDERDVFRRVFEWRGKIYPALRFLKLDLDNMENLFCLVDMAYQLGLEKKRNAKINLIKLVTRTLDLTIKFGPGEEHNTYSSFVGFLQKPKDITRTELNSIISLNYDIGCEQAFSSRGVSFTYGDPWSEVDDSAYKLLKLHGSVNWGVCPKCNYKKANADFRDYTVLNAQSVKAY